MSATGQEEDLHNWLGIGGGKGGLGAKAPSHLRVHQFFSSAY